MASMSKRQADLIEMLLEEKRRIWADVRRELFDKVGDRLQAEYDIPQDVGDRSMIDTLEDTGLAVADIRRQELTRIEEAIQRVKAGRYGRCEECGEEISLARLKVAPYAPCCIDCQKEREAPSSGPGRTL